MGSYYEKHIKILRILLTLFYGLFLAIAIYKNFIPAIQHFIEKKPIDFYTVFKIILGSLMVILTVYSMIVIWTKIYRFIFSSGIGLIVLSILALIVTIIDFVQKYERKQTPESNFWLSIALLIFETVLCVLAIIITFLLVKFVRY